MAEKKDAHTHDKADMSATAPATEAPATEAIPAEVPGIEHATDPTKESPALHPVKLDPKGNPIPEEEKEENGNNKSKK